MAHQPADDAEMASYIVKYRDTDGLVEEIEVEAEDENDADEAAREELTAKSPGTDTDEWEILGVRLAPADGEEAAPSPM